ncbi:MAG: hypothetical protein HQL72_15720 [Magnetococcales bacterium]|nr:hypothetical protein [Magnetococcales bacterium]
MEDMIRAGDSLAQQLEKLLEFPDQTGFLKQPTAINAIRNNVANWRKVALVQEQEKPQDFEESNFEIRIHLRTIAAMLKAVLRSLGEREGLFSLDDITILVEDVLKRVVLASDLTENCEAAYDHLSGELNRSKKQISIIEKEVVDPQIIIDLIQCALARSDMEPAEWSKQIAIQGSRLVDIGPLNHVLEELMAFWIKLAKEQGETVFEGGSIQFYAYMHLDKATTPSTPSLSKIQRLQEMMEPTTSQPSDTEATHRPSAQGG